MKLYQHFGRKMKPRAPSLPGHPEDPPATGFVGGHEQSAVHSGRHVPQPPVLPVEVADRHPGDAVTERDLSEALAPQALDVGDVVEDRHAAR